LTSTVKKRMGNASGSGCGGLVFASPLDNSIAELVHAKSIEILGEVGFCVPEADTLRRLGAAGFPVEPDSQMVRVTPDLLETALDRLPRDVVLYNRAGDKPAPFPRNTQNGPKRGTTLERGSCFMGAGTPVNVFDLETGTRRPATRQDVRDLVALQDALPQVDIVRPTVTATDETSDLVEIAELLRHTGKPIVHRTLSPERVDAAVEMLAAVAGGEDAFQTQPNFATLYCPISPGYFTPEKARGSDHPAQYGDGGRLGASHAAG
jgi:trimethylamine--corrinoid protein Co-methyltransferase